MTIEELYEQYIEQRSINLTIEQFTLFAEFFPAILVILSDGVMDVKEKTYLEKLVKSLANTFAEDGFGKKRIQELQGIFMTEFHFLVTHIDAWKEKYLQALKNHLEYFPESKESILDIIHLFAETSQDVDDAENNMVKFLTHNLNLMDSPDGQAG